MFLNAIQQLYDYQREVTNHLLSVIGWLTHDEFVSIVVERQPSVRETLFQTIVFKNRTPDHFRTASKANKPPVGCYFT